MLFCDLVGFFKDAFTFDEDFPRLGDCTFELILLLDDFEKPD